MSETSFSQKLWSRQVPQLLGTYLAVGFGVLQFVEFMTNRYDFSGAWVDRYLLLWLGLIPAVALVIYYRGLPPAGVSKLGSWKRWLLAGTVILTGLLTILIPGAAANEPATEMVSVVDETGEATQRVIPASSAVQRIAVFDFINAGDKEEEKWLGTAYSSLLNFDLLQRPEILSINSLTLNAYYGRFDKERFSAINVASQRKIAQRAKMDYFIRMEYTVNPDGHEASGAMYRTRDGKALQTLQGASSDIYGVVDQLKLQIVDYLPNQDKLEAVSTNLPASALITDNIDALEAQTKGSIAFSNNNGELDEPVAYFRKALRLDADCAFCAFELGDKLYGQGKKDSAIIIFTQAARLADVLPERLQYPFKTYVLGINSRYEDMYKLMESYRTVYPYEYYPYQSLQGHYEVSFGLDSAIHLMQTAARLSNRELALIQLFKLYLKKEDYPAAENILSELDEEFPDQESMDRRFVELYKASGEYEKARKLIRGKMAIDPLNLELPNQLLAIEEEVGNYDIVEELAQEIFRNSVTKLDSSTAWYYLIQAMAGRGEINGALAEQERYEVSFAKIVPRSRQVLSSYSNKSTYLLKTDDYSRVYDYLEELGRYDPAREEMYRCFLPMQLLLEGMMDEEMVKSIEDCNDVVSNLGPTFIRARDLSLAIIRKEPDKVEAIVDEAINSKSGTMNELTLSRYCRLAGLYDKGIEILEKALKTRTNEPELLLEYAQILHLQAKDSAAAEALKVPLKTWSGADENFRPARHARELAAELGMEVQQDL